MGKKNLYWNRHSTVLYCIRATRIRKKKSINRFRCQYWNLNQLLQMLQKNVLTLMAVSIYEMWDIKLEVEHCFQMGFSIYKTIYIYMPSVCHIYVLSILNCVRYKRKLCANKCVTHNSNCVTKLYFIFRQFYSSYYIKRYYPPPNCTLTLMENKM